MTIFNMTPKSMQSVSIYPETSTYYVVRLNFKHDLNYNRVDGVYRDRAGESKYLWNYHESYEYWQMCENRASACRFSSIRAARDAARQVSRDYYGGDRCCERVIERVVETVDRYAGVKAPPPAEEDDEWTTDPKSCDECRQ